LIALSFVLQISRVTVPVDQPTDEMYFRYGSIGSDVEGVPSWDLPVLPISALPSYRADMPASASSRSAGMPTPIGFSRRQIGPVEIVGPTAAFV